MVYFPVDIERAIARECKRRGYSEKTIKSYTYCINRFLKFTNKTLDKISKKDVKYSKIPKNLPLVLTREELKRLFATIDNEKHKLMIKLMYSAGLRVSELLNLKTNDLEISKGYGYVRKGKGNKDRIFIIASSLKDDLIKLISLKKLNEFEYLFINNRHTKYNVSTPRMLIKKAAKEARINKKISPHTLRHSFATHLIENGYSISEVQALLGHKSPETTLIYLHTSLPNMIKVKSPLDNLQ